MGDVKTREPQTQGLSVNSLVGSISFNLLVYFPEISASHFSMKTNKRKITKCLKYLQEFSRRFVLANGKYLSIFLGIFARISEVTHFAQVINFRKRTHGKIHPRKVDKNNRESTFFFSTQQ